MIEVRINETYAKPHKYFKLLSY